MFYIFNKLYLHNILYYHYRCKSHKVNFCYFITYAPNCITIHNFFSIAAATRYRSDNLTAKHSKKIAHIQLSRKDNEITWATLKSRNRHI